MNLPSDLSRLILQNLGMPDLDITTQKVHTKKLQIIRKQMKTLASDFAACVPSEDRYADGYFAYNFPTNVAKTMVVVQEMMQVYPGLLSNKKSWHILDIGCGEGAGLYGIYYGIREYTRVDAFNVIGIDRSLKMLSRAKYLSNWLRNTDPNVKISFLKRAIGFNYRFALRPKYDLVLCVNSLTEIVQGVRIPMRFLNSILNSLTDGGLLIIIEPALKRSSRRLMSMRDELSSNERTQVLLPCLHDNPCALLKLDSRNEWCHQSVTWSPPRFLEVLNQGLSREIDILKFAYLVIAKRRMHLRKPKGYRVVSQLLKEKGKQRCFLCTPEGRVELVRLNRSKSVTNAAFDSIYKGAVVSLKNVMLKKKDMWQVAQQTAVDIAK
jgi:ribosomal protein RSM22 (predicted rRNA methylase)